MTNLLFAAPVGWEPGTKDARTINSALAVHARDANSYLVPSSTHARQEIFVGPLHLVDDFEAALGQVPDCRA